VSKKPAELPNIEDATLRACLAPLVDAIHSNVAHPVLETTIGGGAQGGREPGQSGGRAGSNDNPVPSNGSALGRYPEHTEERTSFADWRSVVKEDLGVSRTIECFLAMTEAELDQAVATFPRQIRGTVARISQLKRRLAAQYDAVTTVLALLERAQARTAPPPGSDRDRESPATTRVHFPSRHDPASTKC
jgi:hypothetical protein